MQDQQQELLKRYSIITHSYIDNDIEDIPKLLKQINKITKEKEGSLIQLLNTDNICGKKHLNQAISQAIKAFDEEQNFANDKGLEICVRLSAQKQITEALNILGIKPNGNITVVYIDTTSKQIEKTEQLLGKKDDELLETYDINSIKKIYSISNDELKLYSIIDCINEKIAMLTLKN